MSRHKALDSRAASSTGRGNPMLLTIAPPTGTMKFLSVLCTTASTRPVGNRLSKKHNAHAVCTLTRRSTYAWSCARTSNTLYIYKGWIIRYTGSGHIMLHATIQAHRSGLSGEMSNVACFYSPLRQADVMYLQIAALCTPYALLIMWGTPCVAHNLATATTSSDALYMQAKVTHSWSG